MAAATVLPGVPSETRDAMATKLGQLEELLALPDADIIHAYKEYTSFGELLRSPDLVAAGTDGMKVESEEDKDEEDEEDAPLLVRFGSTS